MIRRGKLMSFLSDVMMSEPGGVPLFCWQIVVRPCGGRSRTNQHYISNHHHHHHHRTMLAHISIRLLTHIYTAGIRDRILDWWAHRNQTLLNKYQNILYEMRSRIIKYIFTFLLLLEWSIGWCGVKKIGILKYCFSFMIMYEVICPNFCWYLRDFVLQQMSMNSNSKLDSSLMNLIGLNCSKNAIYCRLLKNEKSRVTLPGQSSAQ